MSRSSGVHSLQASSVLALLPRLVHKADSEKRVHPHGVCQPVRPGLAMERIPVHVIRKQLGHASLHTTTVYLEYIAPPSGGTVRNHSRRAAPVELADTMRWRSWNL